jgi:site-specific DNA recombinase
MYATGTISLGDLANFAKENGLSNSYGKTINPKTLAKNVIAEMLKNPFYYGEMYVKKYNKLFPHKYERLITKALFDECQIVTKKRSTTNNRSLALQNSNKEFVFRGLIKCAVTGKTVSSDRKEDKTNKNTYLIAWNPENQTKKIFVPEHLILSEVTDIFKAISVPDEMLLEITARLQQSHEAEKEYHTKKVEKLKKDEENIKSKINRLLDIYLERGVSEIAYADANTRLEAQLAALRVDIEAHEAADTNFKQTLVTAFKLANKASDLFESSKISEKRELINFLFSNLALRGRKLEYTLRKPFDMMINLDRCSKWLPRTGSNRRQGD